MRFRLLPLLFLSMLFACDKEFEEDFCGRDFFSPNKETAYILDSEVMILEEVSNEDTTFLYLQWFISTNQKRIFLIDPGHDLFTDEEPGSHYRITGAVKVSCENQPTINDQPTEIIEIITAESIPYCPVEVEDGGEKQIKQTLWRLVGIESDNTFQSPTCEDNFLSIVMTTAKVNLLNESDQRFIVDILNGVRDCDYHYEFLSEEVVRFTEARCYRINIATTTNSGEFGEAFMSQILNSDGLQLIHEKDKLILSPVGSSDQLHFKGL